MSRHTKLTPEVQERMCALTREGRHDLHICRLVGIGDTTLDDWLKRGESAEADEPFRGFARAYREAQAEGEIALLERLSLMAQDSQGKDCASLRWMLSKKNPGLFGDRTKSEIVGPNDGPVQVARVVMMPPADMTDEATGYDDDDDPGCVVVAQSAAAGRGPIHDP